MDALLLALLLSQTPAVPETITFVCTNECMMEPKPTVACTGECMTLRSMARQQPRTLGIGEKETPMQRAAHWTTGAFVVAGFADLSTTMYMSGKGGFVEANPLMRPFYKSPVKMALVKGGITTGVTYLMLYMHKRHPKLVAIGSSILAAGTGYVAWRNSKLERGQ